MDSIEYQECIGSELFFHGNVFSIHPAVKRADCKVIIGKGKGEVSAWHSINLKLAINNILVL